MKKYIRKANATYDLDFKIRSFLPEDKKPVYVLCPTYGELFDAISEVAQKDADSHLGGVTKSLSDFPYLKSLYYDVSKDACRRAIYKDNAIKCYICGYEKAFRSDLENLIDCIYQASPMSVFVCSSCQDSLAKEAAESAAKVYKQKISSMIWKWADQVYTEAFWAELRKVVDKAIG